MKKFLLLVSAAILGSLAFLPAPARAQVPQLLNYQGRVAVGTVNFDGSGSFKFALVNAAGTTTYWSNDGTSTTGDEPVAAVALTVTKGLWSALLGDTALTNMTAIPAGVFANADVRLRVWFNDGTNGSQLLTPDQRLAPAAYLAGGAVTSAAIAAGAVGGTQIAAGAVGATQIAAGAVGAAQLGGNAAVGNTADTLVLRDASGAFSAGVLSLDAINLPATTATTGQITLGGPRMLHAFGNNNLFLGQGAGNFTMSGSYNTASGFQALYSNTTASFNTASGYQALYYNTTGNNNSASGAFALYSNTIGGSNSASGTSALLSNTAGNENTASGYGALRFNTTGINNTASGSQALLNNTTGTANTASGYGALRFNTGGSNTAIGAGALNSNTTGYYNTAIGYGADVSGNNLTNATAIGANAQVNASNKVRIGNGLVAVIEGEVAFTFSSDRNRKENFQPVDGDEVLRKIRGFNLTSWNYIGQDAQQFRHYGPMAQDFFAAFGHDAVGTSGTPTTINSGDMAGITMIAVKALATENAALKKRLAALETKDRERDAREKEREARLAKLEQSLSPAREARATTAALQAGELRGK